MIFMREIQDFFTILSKQLGILFENETTNFPHDNKKNFTILKCRRWSICQPLFLFLSLP